MKTIEITNAEQIMLLSSLKLVNHYHKKYVGDPDFRGDIKARIRLFRKLVKLYNIQGTQY